MGKAVTTGMGIVLLAALAGCRSAARVVEVPRVDLELSGSGNRGYLVGSPSSTPNLKTRRRMVETEVELPLVSRPGAPGAELTDLAPPEIDLGTEDSWSMAPRRPQTFDAYTVKKKDTLWSIAANPAVFGDATRWRQIFNANRDQLKSPDQVRAGMMLKIPRGAAAASDQTVLSPEPAEQPAWTK